MVTQTKETAVVSSSIASSDVDVEIPAPDVTAIYCYDDPYDPPRWRRIVGFAWDSFKLEPEERRFIQRLDFFLFSYSLLSYVVKYLDQGNVSNAYVSGMKEDLNLQGQERNLFTTFFNIGYLIGSIPSQIIINRTRASIFIPTCELVWSILVMCLAAVQNAKTVYGIRFVIGLAEATVFPGFALILGSWYYPDQMGKRMALFEVSSSAAGMFSGYIQSGVYATLNGHLGIAGWRWAFIIDGVISVPIACMGYFCIPDFPTTTRAIWLSQKDREYAVARMAKIGRKPPRPITAKRLLQFFMSPRAYVFQGPYNVAGFGSSSGYFNLWLKSTGKFSVEMINILPTAGNAISIVVTYTFSMLSDLTGRRGPFAFAVMIVPFFCNIVLAVWNIPYKFKLAVQLLNYAGFGYQPIVIAWAAEAFQDDAETRGLVVGFGNTINYAMSAWLPLVMYPTNLAPHYPVGYQISAMFYGLAMLTAKKRGKVYNELGLAIDKEDVLIPVGDEAGYRAEVSDSVMEEKHRHTTVVKEL
ncbi:major facilitator superfamily domain-containing protein [Myxozyma melibiosi]|uniref:Major facilitator superfamily domain-containing protein n=1 Tax=Myxozyma melibiosi TaxID=54550 RepID=A0ABR1EYM6_9ASCO